MKYFCTSDLSFKAAMSTCTIWPIFSSSVIFASRALAFEAGLARRTGADRLRLAKSKPAPSRRFTNEEGGRYCIVREFLRIGIRLRNQLLSLVASGRGRHGRENAMMAVTTSNNQCER